MRGVPVLVLLLVATALVATVFAVAPSIDLKVAAVFYRGGTIFVGQTPLGELTRRIVYWVPTALLVLYGLRRFAGWAGWAPTGREVMVLALSFALGPGLLVNTVLKDHSHRPRPYQTIGFGGDEAFRPFYSFDGACDRNCSFVSGEGAAAAWTIAPALLLPPPVRAAAVAASLLFALGVATLRMAFGGHYLSDSLFAALFTWLVIWATWQVLRRRPAHTKLDNTSS